MVLGDLTQPQLGLTTAEFERLAKQSDLVLHNGAQVNWLTSYARLQPANVRGTESIIRLAACGAAPALHYVSSLAVFPVVGHAERVTIDECTPLDHGGILHGGYTQSKWVAEKLVTEAQARGFRTAIYRPSLVVGDSRSGAWFGDNIVATMLRSWVKLGMAPDVDGELDLVPVDYVSRAIVGLMGGCPNPGIYHLNGSRPIKVAELIDWLGSCGYDVRKVPYAVWRGEMLRSDDAGRQLMLNAIGPLLALQVSEDVGWLAHVPRFRNHNAAPSIVGGECPAVDAALLRKLVGGLR